MKKTFFIVLAVCAIIILLGVGSYNGFVSSKEAIKNQFAQVETQYQRRVDLIPNLVESVKGVMKQEKDIFDNLAQARTNYMNANTATDKIKASQQVDTTLSKLLVVMENYPQLKSSENVQTLMAQIEGTENRISVERKNYNDVVRTYNLKVKTFPSNVVAGVFSFAPEEYFASEQGANIAPKVKF